eukprot:5830533-Pleurochrysis_carterae.AAC.1
MTCMWDEARPECMARARDTGVCAPELATCHSYSPPRRRNGSRRRVPSFPGASSIAHVPAKRQSMPADAH